MLLLRHGQSYFNLHFSATRRDPGIEDPELTELGHAQAYQAAEDLADMQITRLIVSPYTRALQTAAPFLNRPGIQVEILSQVRERTAFVCDVGSTPAVLSARFPQHNFNHLATCWWGEGKETEAQTIQRARGFQETMRQRDDSSTTLLVSHWGFLLALSGESVANGRWIGYNPATAAPEHIIWKP